MKYFFFGYLVLFVVVIAILGFRGQKFEQTPIEIFNDMDHQSKFKSQTETFFFADGRADRPPVPGTRPHGVPTPDQYYASGLIDGKLGDGIPIPITEELLARGKERYEIYCQVCHGANGSGNGIVSQYGFAGIANYHDDRIVESSDGHIYRTIAYGKGLMVGLPHIPVDDRWAIVSYVRALQRSQRSTLEDVPENQRAKLLAELQKEGAVTENE